MTLKRTLVAAAAAVLMVAAPAAASATTISTPVGTWDGVVTVDQDPPHNAKFFFASNGTACLTFGSPDDVHGTGTGQWWHTADNEFTYKITHTVILADGTLVGTVRVGQEALQSADRYVSSGPSTVYDPEGNPVSKGTTKVEAQRTDGSDPTCQS